MNDYVRFELTLGFRDNQANSVVELVSWLASNGYSFSFSQTVPDSGGDPPITVDINGAWTGNLAAISERINLLFPNHDLDE